MLSPTRLVKTVVWLALAISTASLLQACVPLFVGGVVKGVSMVRDRRTTGQQVTDQGIELKLAGQFSAEFGSNASISVKCYQGKVLLTGEAASELSRQKATSLANGVDGVKSVINQVTIGPNAPFSDVSNDAWISSSVFTAMSTENGVPSRTIETTVRQGHVYLMGLVTEAEGDVAATVASRINGVKSVNKVFTTITPQQAAKLDESAGSTANDNNANSNGRAPIRSTDSPSYSTPSNDSGAGVQVMPIK